MTRFEFVRRILCFLFFFLVSYRHKIVGGISFFLNWAPQLKSLTGLKLSPNKQFQDRRRKGIPLGIPSLWYGSQLKIL